MFKAEVPYKVVGQVTGLDSMKDSVMLFTQRFKSMLEFWIEPLMKASRYIQTSGFGRVHFRRTLYQRDRFLLSIRNYYIATAT
jgi:hypothetical protein